MVTRRRQRFPRLTRLLKVLGVLLILGGTGAGLWEGYRILVRLPYFRVAEVQVEGNLQVAAQDIIDSLELSPQTSILEVDLPGPDPARPAEPLDQGGLGAAPVAALAHHPGRGANGGGGLHLGPALPAQRRRA